MLFVLTCTNLKMVLAFDDKDGLNKCQFVIYMRKLNSFITADICNQCGFHRQFFPDVVIHCTVFSRP